MKKLTLLFTLLLSMSISAWADSIRCYDHGRLIYYRNVKDVTFTGDMFIFTELPSDKIVLYTGDCLVKIDA